MKITTDSAIKNQIAFQLKYIKTMESNASRLGMNELVQSFRQQRNNLTKSINRLIGHKNSTSGIARFGWTGWTR